MHVCMLYEQQHQNKGLQDFRPDVSNHPAQHLGLSTVWAANKKDADQFASIHRLIYVFVGYNRTKLSLVFQMYQADGYLHPDSDP